jgi:hypothetical protein
VSLFEQTLLAKVFTLGCRVISDLGAQWAIRLPMSAQTGYSGPELKNTGTAGESLERDRRHSTATPPLDGIMVVPVRDVTLTTKCNAGPMR